MTQQLQKCLDENGNELKGWRWDSESGCIYHYKSIRNHSLRFSTGIKSEDSVISKSVFNKAVKVANYQISQRIKLPGYERNLRPLLREIISKIVKRYSSRPTQSGKKNHTLNTVKSSFVKIEDFWGKLFPEEITSEKWDEFQDWWDLNYPGYNSFNVTKYMRILRNECLDRGFLKLRPKIIDRNRKVLRLKRNAKKDWVYTDEEVFNLDVKGCITDQERIIVRLGYQSAFRISDSLSARLSSFDFSGEVPVYKFKGHDKTEKYIPVPITDEVASLVRKLVLQTDFLFPQERDKEKHLWPQQFNFEAIKDRAGVTRGTPHSLRHYRLTKDFKNPKYTTIQVCLSRRISLEEAFKSYVHREPSDLKMLQNAGSLSSLKETLGV